MCFFDWFSLGLSVNWLENVLECHKTFSMVKQIRSCLFVEMSVLSLLWHYSRPAFLPTSFPGKLLNWLLQRILWWVSSLVSTCLDEGIPSNLEKFCFACVWEGASKMRSACESGWTRWKDWPQSGQAPSIRWRFRKEGVMLNSHTGYQPLASGLQDSHQWLTC